MNAMDVQVQTGITVSVDQTNKGSVLIVNPRLTGVSAERH